MVWYGHKQVDLVIDEPKQQNNKIRWLKMHKEGIQEIYDEIIAEFIEENERNPTEEELEQFCVDAEEAYCDGQADLADCYRHDSLVDSEQLID